LAGIIATSVSKAWAAGPWVYAYTGGKEANATAQEETWGAACADGQEQSPINIVTSAAVVSESLPNIETHITAQVRYLKNTGHGFQLFETNPSTHGLTRSDQSTVDSRGAPKGYSMIGGEMYSFYQVHWHSPSENTVDGESFPLEAHFVHQLSDPSLVGTLHRLAVIGLLYELGDCNPVLDQFWPYFTEERGNRRYGGPEIDLDAKLSEELKHGYYHWYGSLTTPPCTEGVSWNLLQARETVCQAQVSKITAALAKTQSGIGFNNRVTRPLNHRTVSVTNRAVEAAVEESQEKSTWMPVATLVLKIAVVLFGFLAILMV